MFLKNSIFFICLLLDLSSQTALANQNIDKCSGVTRRTETIPSRNKNAISGSEFARRTSGMTGAERQQAALAELRHGNIPEFLRNLKPVRMYYTPAGKAKINAVIWVMPDYLAIGSEEDFLRIPLDYETAITIVNEWGFTLPTRKIVDEIYKQSTCHLEPSPLPPGPNMRSSEYYLKHRSKIKTQRKNEGCALGELVSGHKKDVVITNLLNNKPGRIAIYGWHRKNGEPIQPLSTIHGKRYADYSHGIRLVYKTVWINEEPGSIFDVLQNKDLAPLLTYEGVINRLLRMLRLKSK